MLTRKIDKNRLRLEATAARKAAVRRTRAQVKTDITDFDAINDQIEALALALADPMADEAENTQHRAFPHFAMSHGASVEEAGAKPDTANAASLYTVKGTKKARDPEGRRGATIDVPAWVRGKTLADFLPGTWATDAWLFACRIDNADARSGTKNEAIAYVLNCYVTRGGKDYHAAVAVGLDGDTMTKGWEVVA